jgi:hypothetical protein
MSAYLLAVGLVLALELLVAIHVKLDGPQRIRPLATFDAGDPCDMFPRVFHRGLTQRVREVRSAGGAS